MSDGSVSEKALWHADGVEIDRITPEIAGVATYFLRFVDPQAAARYRFCAGQFNMLYLPGVGEIAISISDDPSSRDVLAHTIREAGNTTRTLARLGIGGRLALRGPFGVPWPVTEYEDYDVLLVAGGLGLAPLRPAVYQLLANRARYGRLWLLYGARSPADLLFQAEYESWIKHGLELRLTVDRSAAGWQGDVGVLPLLIDRLRLPNPQRTVMFSCGPEVMMRFAAKSAAALGIDNQRIYLSLERNMQCAGGLCGHCQLGPIFVCKDGPVVRYDRVAELMRVEAL